MASHRILWKCPCCGSLRNRRAFVAGSHGVYPPQVLRQDFMGGDRGRRRDGSAGGSFIWSRRPMNVEERELVGRALAAAARTLEEYSELPDEPLPDDEILAAVDGDERFLDHSDEWVASARRELERREAIVRAEANRRLDRLDRRRGG